jgi:hypothetical protein
MRLISRRRPGCSISTASVRCPTDSAAPAATYAQDTIAPPPGGNFLLTLGNLAANAVVKKSGFDLARKVSERMNQSANGTHMGFAPGDRSPIITVTLEATALVGTPYTSAAAFDGYQLRDKAQQIIAALKYGSTQYNRLTINFPQAQVIDVQDSDVDDVPCVDLTIAAFNSTETANDDHNIVTD